MIDQDDLERRLAAQPVISQFERDKLERDAKKNWDLFYKRNGDRFFKSRYWTRHEFNELFINPDTVQDKSSTKYLLEIGCGCGDFILPLLEELDSYEKMKLFIYCCDLSDQAIALMKCREVYEKHHPHSLKAFVADVTAERSYLVTELEEKQMDFISLVFVLSAIEPLKMSRAVRNIRSVLKPEGLVLFRDYARLDEAMLRFADTSKICDNFYRRQDGTRAYFFSESFLLNLFKENGFECLSIECVKRETLNNSTQQKFSRMFMQAKFKINPSWKEN